MVAEGRVSDTAVTEGCRSEGQSGSLKQGSLKERARARSPPRYTKILKKRRSRNATFGHFVIFVRSDHLPEPGPGLTPEESEGWSPSDRLNQESPECHFAYLIAQNWSLTPEESGPEGTEFLEDSSFLWLYS